jgi:glycosyltransferase involved in cell wall biosynthesis
VGGLAEVVEDGVNGLLVPGRSPEKLAEAAGRILRDPGLTASLASGGRRAVETRFSLDTQIRMVEGILADCLPGGLP